MSAITDGMLNPKKQISAKPTKAPFPAKNKIPVVTLLSKNI